MGQVISLDQRRAPVRPERRPQFFFDVSSPLSYLISERIERLVGEVDWIAADEGRLRRIGGAAARERAPAAAGLGWADAEHDDSLSLRARAEAQAHALRLPLVWPDRFPGAAPCAQRAAAFACEIGAGAAFALAASRLAFCGGFDLEDPETLAEAAAAAGVPLEECLAAAGESWRDADLESAALELQAHGVSELPAVRIDRRWLDARSGLFAPGVLLPAAAPGRTLAPLA